MKKKILILVVIVITSLVIVYQYLSTTGMVEKKVFERKSRYYVVAKVQIEGGKIIQLDKEINKI